MFPLLQILERVEFLEETLTQRLLTRIEDEDILGALTNTVLSLECENYDLNGLLASISSESLYDWNLKSAYSDGDSKVLLGNTYSSASPDDSFPSMYMTLEEGMSPMHGYSSYLGDQLTPAIEAQVVDVHCKEANAFSSDELAAQDSELTSLYSMNRMLDPTGTFLYQLANSVDNNQPSTQSSIVTTEVDFPDSLSTVVHGLSENLELPVDTLEEFSEFSMDDLCQYLASSPENNICETVTALDNSAFDDIPPVIYPALHNSITATVNLDGQQTISTFMNGSENSTLLDSNMGLDLSCDQQGDEWWGTAGIDTTSFFDCLSVLNVPTTLGGSGKRLFTIEELLNGEANSNSLNSCSSFGDQLSSTNNKQQVTEHSPVNKNIPVQLASLGLSWGARVDLVQPVSELNKTKKEIFPKLQVGGGGLWKDDRHSNTRRVVPAQPQNQVEPNKVTRMKGRPGETCRPRPKDRQQIQDCIEVLRRIIPNSGKVNHKCS